jgi:hypothetical protein
MKKIALDGMVCPIALGILQTKIPDSKPEGQRKNLTNSLHHNDHTNLLHNFFREELKV